ncbi:MAG: hypothetical protein PVJ08_08735 [Dehalococcoidia bacterium]
MELRQKTNDGLFTLYEVELTFHHRSGRGLQEAKRILNHFHSFIGEFPPTPELVKSFLATFRNHKSTVPVRKLWSGAALNHIVITTMFATETTNKGKKPVVPKIFPKRSWRI